MALADPVKFTDNVLDTHKIVKSAGIVTKWVEAITAGGADDADNAGSDITDPENQITASTRRIIQTADRGTLVVIRLAYDDGLTGITDPDVQLFGRFDSGEPWQLLRNLAGATDAALVTAASDVTDGTLLRTTPHLENNIYDLLGCREVLVGVKTALAGTGDTTNALIEIKLVN